MRPKFAALATPAPKDAPMNIQPPLEHSPLGMFRPVLWLAAAAFAAGFGGYMILGLRVING